MQPLETKQSADFKWNLAVLIAVAFVMILIGTVSHAQHENGPVTPVAASADSPAQIVIDNFVYSPVPLTVKVGTQVTWINHDDIPHTVDSTQGKFKSAALDTDDKFEFKFTEAGEYPFFCRIHPKMAGKIIVQP